MVLKWHDTSLSCR